MIKIQELSKSYGDVLAVDKINLEIKKGEILGLLGPNGAGKTTTLRVLTCYMPPTSGTIMVKDFNINDHARNIKELIGYLPESAPLYSDMLVYDYLHFVADVRGIDSRRKEPSIRELAELCGLKEVMHKSIHELSKGYKQRVGLAHAMMDDPEILVLDEPSSGLDPNQRIEIREIIKEIGKEKTVILSTHILPEAEATCDRIVIINKGKIVADDSTVNLRQSAGKETVIDLILAKAQWEEVKNSFLAMPEVSEVKPLANENGELHLSLISRSREDIRMQVYELIKQSSWGLLGFHRETRSLENIFRELTKEA